MRSTAERSGEPGGGVRTRQLATAGTSKEARRVVFRRRHRPVASQTGAPELRLWAQRSLARSSRNPGNEPPGFHRSPVPSEVTGHERAVDGHARRRAWAAAPSGLVPAAARVTAYGEALRLGGIRVRAATLAPVAGPCRQVPLSAAEWSFRQRSSRAPSAKLCWSGRAV